MKHVISIVLVAIAMQAGAQMSIPVTFTVNERTEASLSEKYEVSSYSPLSQTIEVRFTGEKLSMKYTNSGKVYYQTNVQDYWHKESRDLGELNYDVFTLKVKEGEFSKYVVIEKHYHYTGDYYVVRIPFVDKRGLVLSYDYFQKF
jgi:hypothetical protein